MIQMKPGYLRRRQTKAIRAKWQEQWATRHAMRWIDRGGKLYPLDSIVPNDWGHPQTAEARRG